jgi:hypothetical protein
MEEHLSCVSVAIQDSAQSDIPNGHLRNAWKIGTGAIGAGGLIILLYGRNKVEVLNSNQF